MKRYVFAFLIILSVPVRVLAQTDDEIRFIADELARKISETTLRKVAITDIQNLDRTVTNLGRFLGDALSMHLPEAGRGFQVVDRSQTALLIEETKLFSGGVLNREAGVKLGEMTGIQAIVNGTVTEFTGFIQVNIKVYDLQKGIILRTVSGRLTTTPDIIKLLQHTPGPAVADQAIPKPKKNCQEKPSCVVCVTNNSRQIIEVQPMLSNNLYVYDGVKLLLHPGKVKCWGEMGFSVSGDHDTVRVDVFTDEKRTKYYKQLIEPCQVYNVVHE